MTLTSSQIWRHVLVLCLYISFIHAQFEDPLYQASFAQLLQSGELDLQSEDNAINQHSHTPDTSAGHFSPWSHEPVCTGDSPRLQSGLCVYTDDSFGNGRGLSLFTTPRIAGKFARSHLRDRQASPNRHGEAINTSSGTWYTKEVPDKGIGMFAKKDLHRGDLVTSYTPVLLAYKENIMSKPEREQYLRTAISQLPPPSREAYESLATLHDESSFRMQGIASANSFEINIAGTAHLTVIPEPSRINHDCAPNAIFIVNATALTHTVRATRPIMKDEEITIAYTSPLEPFSKRQQYLSNSFGFTCICRRCQRDVESDAFLNEIALLRHSLASWSNPASSASTIQAERLVRIHRDEGLEGYLDPVYCIAALLYSSVGSERGAKKYLRLCIEGIDLRLGSGAEDLLKWREMLADPRAHWSWMKRKRG